jgi:hypothetical protein
VVVAGQFLVCCVLCAPISYSHYRCEIHYPLLVAIAIRYPRRRRRRHRGSGIAD